MITYVYKRGDTVFLMYVYDKSMMDTIADSALRKMVNELKDELEKTD